MRTCLPNAGREQYETDLRTTKNSNMQKRTKRMSSKTMWILSITTAALMLVATLAVAPRLSANPQQAATAEVEIDNFSFGPATLTVAPGTTVTWVNHDDIPHTVVSTDSVFKSKVLDTDEKFSFTFTKAGTYPYFCSIHPKMTATVVVKSPVNEPESIRHYQHAAGQARAACGADSLPDRPADYRRGI